MAEDTDTPSEMYVEEIEVYDYDEYLEVFDIDPSEFEDEAAITPTTNIK